MDLFERTLWIAGLMAFSGGALIYFPWIRHISTKLFLFGTGGLVGVVFFDLIPDLYEMTGLMGALGWVSIWVLYSAFHFWHDRQKHKRGHEDCHGHQHEDEHHHVLLHAEEGGIPFFMIAMTLHCIASGVLLAISGHFGDHFSLDVFKALITHKGYEALIVASLVLEKFPIRWKALTAVLSYSLALPLGVLLAISFSELFTPTLANALMSVSLGTLMGCLVFDFVLPTFHHLRKHPRRVTWVFAGLAITKIWASLIG